MKHELTHIPSRPRCAHHASKAEHNLNSTYVSSAPPKTANFQSFKCDYLVLKDTAASDGLKVLSTYVKSFGYGTSTAVETKCNRHVRSDMDSENVELRWTLRHHFAM